MIRRTPGWNLWILRISYCADFKKFQLAVKADHQSPVLCRIGNRGGIWASGGQFFAHAAGYQPKSVRRTSSRVGIEADAPGRLTAIAAALLASRRASAAVFPRAMAAIK